MLLFRDTQWHSVPVGTTSIQVTYMCTRYQGTDCDGYADNLALTVAVYSQVTADQMDCPATTAPLSCTQGYMLNEALPSPSAQLSVKQINAILQAHNDMRRNVVPAARTMPMLTWDQTLADLALSYAQSCPGLVRSSLAARTNPAVSNYGYLGENVAGGPDNATYGIDAGANVVAVWNSESKGYTYVGPPTCTLSDQSVCGTCTLSDCSHYTQNVWANTKTVGCAFAYCPGSPLKNYWVCEYGPGGNYMGQPPYDSSAPMDACQLNGTATLSPVMTAVPTVAPAPEIAAAAVPSYRERRSLLAEGTVAKDEPAPSGDSTAVLAFATTVGMLVVGVGMVTAFLLIRRGRVNAVAVTKPSPLSPHQVLHSPLKKKTESRSQSPLFGGDFTNMSCVEHHDDEADEETMQALVSPCVSVSVLGSRPSSPLASVHSPRRCSKSENSVNAVQQLAADNFKDFGEEELTFPPPFASPGYNLHDLFGASVTSPRMASLTSPSYNLRDLFGSASVTSPRMPSGHFNASQDDDNLQREHTAVL
jgi:hypothetical protein